MNMQWALYGIEPGQRFIFKNVANNIFLTLTSAEYRGSTYSSTLFCFKFKDQNGEEWLRDNYTVSHFHNEFKRAGV